jgi:hypothetical protein
MKKPIIAVIVTLLIVPVLYAVFFVLNAKSSIFKPTRNSAVQNQETQPEESIPEDEFVPRLNISEIVEDLALIKETSQSSGAFKPRYFDIGKVKKGEFKDDNIVIMIKNYPLTSDALITTFVLGDDNTYYTQDKLTKESYNLEKVKLVRDLGLSHPESIKLNDTFTLYKQNIMTDYIYTGNKDTNDTLLYQTVISGDLSRAEKLGKLGELEVFGYTESSEILLTDEAGVTYIYSIAFTNINSNLRYTLNKKDINMTAPIQIYNSYGTAVPTDCATNKHTKLAQGYDVNKLTSLGTYNGSEVFIYNDSNFYLHKSEFQSKIATQSFGNDTEFTSKNNASRPTFEEYIQKNPVIFIKDYWGRLLAFGEQDFKMLNKCE